MDSSTSRITPNPRALVTGGGSGIGLGVGRRLARAGFKVLLVSRSDSVEREASSLAGHGLEVTGFSCNVADYEALGKAYRMAAGDRGSLDLVVHAAGVVYPGTISDFVPTEWEETIRTNVLGVMYGCRHALGYMGEGSLIVNVSSVSGREPSGNAAYCASKHAVTGFTEVLRREVAGRGIRVTCLEPGLVVSELDRHHPLAFREERASSPALRPEEMAELVWWLWNSPRHVNVGELVVRHVSQL